MFLFFVFTVPGQPISFGPVIFFAILDPMPRTKHVAYVMQEDALLAFETPRDCLRFSARRGRFCYNSMRRVAPQICFVLVLAGFVGLRW